MLRLPLIALFIRTIPEGLIVTWICYLLMNKEIDKKRICLSGILFGILTYVIRMLPINFGIHMIVMLIAFIIILHKINQIDLYKAVLISIVSFILQVISEWITIVVYVLLIHIDTQILSQQSVQSTLLGIPSLVIMFVIGLLIRQFKKRERERGKSNV